MKTRWKGGDDSMEIRLILAYFFNLIDMVATLYLNQKGGYIEANPFVRYLLQRPQAFIFVKAVLMAFVLFFIWQDNASTYAKIASWFAVIFYGAIVLYYYIILT